MLVSLALIVSRRAGMDFMYSRHRRRMVLSR